MQKGPSFKILSSCEHCEFRIHFSCQESGYQVPLDKYHNTPSPHINCPFLLLNKKDFLEREYRDLKFAQFNKIEKIVKETFPDLTDYSLYSDSGIITFTIITAKLEDLNKLSNRTNRKISIFAEASGFKVILTADCVNENNYNF